jgi:recombination protein RecT
MLYLTKEETIEHAKKYSKAYGSGKSPWQTETDKMGIKTVLRQLLKYGPMSTEMQEAEKMEAKSAEAAAKATIAANANQGTVDIPAVDVAYEEIQVDDSTGEIIDQPPFDGSTAPAVAPDF